MDDLSFDPSAQPEAPASAAPSLLPWEDRENFPAFWSRVGGMFQLLFKDPIAFFEHVPSGAGFSRPWTFILLCAVPIFLIMGLIFMFFGMAFLAGLAQERGADKAILAFLPFILLAILALMPLFMFLAMLINGSLHHLFLWMWGGTKAGVSVEQTIRATGYANAFLQIGGLIPYLGILIQLAGLVVLGMGLARMHRTDTWRGVCAVLTPLFLICCCLVVAMFFIIGLAASGKLN